MLIMIKCGEIVLKGLNRHLFEEKLMKNIKFRLRDLGKVRLRCAQSTIFLETDDTGAIDKMFERLKYVFGISNISKVYNCEKDMDKVLPLALKIMEETGAETFKVETKRSDKKFPYNSPQISRMTADYIYDNIKGKIKADMKNPDVVLRVDVRDCECYVYVEREKGAGGMPTGTNGRATLLLSGGIDSPVAGWMIAKRGVELNAVHFHSYPYTSERAKEKVTDLAKLMARYCGRIKLHVVPFTELQLAINDNCPEDEGTIIMRRMMARIAEKIAVSTDSQALITGESIGQVASQTMFSLAVTNHGLDLPVFRPLIGFDKDEIIQIARKIDTFETSVLPYEDCCTVFVAKHPKTKPQLAAIEESESKFDYMSYIEKAISETKVITIDPEWEV